MSSRFPQFRPAPPDWPEHLDLVRQWATYVGTERAFMVPVLALSQLWPAKPFWIGIGARRFEDADDATPCEVWYVPLNVYERTIAALVRSGPHSDGERLVAALGLGYPSLDALRAALVGYWEEPSPEAVVSGQRNAGLGLSFD